MHVNPPWWFCNGWWSPWCVIDTVMHDVFYVPLDTHNWVCRKHDAAIPDRREVDQYT